jgi:putative membrane protein
MKRKRSEGFFSEEENSRIRAAVEAAEAGTSGEIVAMVVDRSDSYREAEILGAVLTSALLALLVEVAIQFVSLWVSTAGWGHGGQLEAELVLYGVSVWTYVPLTFVLFFPLRHLFRKCEPLKLPFVGRKRIQEAVRERAVRAFYEKGLYRTRDETGILIFLSLLEHKVWILGDRGINRKIPHEDWQGLARELSLGMKQGRVCEALCSVIASCGAELARHFPRRADDTNELTDEVIRH